MQWLFLLIAYLPIISVVLGAGLLIAGCVLRKTKRNLSLGMLIAGGSCIAICPAFYLILFLIGALGIGPVPN